MPQHTPAERRKNRNSNSENGFSLLDAASQINSSIQNYLTRGIRQREQRQRSQRKELTEPINSVAKRAKDLNAPALLEATKKERLSLGSQKFRDEEARKRGGPFARVKKRFKELTQ